MRVLILMAKLADSFTFWLLTLSGFSYLWQDRVFEACALICTAVFWQRFEKVRILEAIKKGREGV